MTYDKATQKTYAREHYLNNKKLYYDRTAYRFHIMQVIAKELKLEPCMDCGVKYPYYVMQFDHRPGEVKIRYVSDYHNFSSVVKFLEEVYKCDLVCANCHAERTHGPNNQDRFHGKKD